MCLVGTSHTPSNPRAGKGGQPAGAGVVCCPPVTQLVEFHLHLDADRDGKVDDSRTGLDKWEWGAGKKGAIILCNNDDDEGTKASDNEDDKVSKANDPDEI